MSNNLKKSEIDLIVDGLYRQLASDQEKLLKELQEARKDLTEAQETIAAFNELKELLPVIKQMGISFDPQILQKNITACVRGECRRLNLNISDIRKKLPPLQVPPQVPLAQQTPPQAPPAPQVFSCEVCGSQFSYGVERCPACGVFLDWSGSS